MISVVAPVFDEEAALPEFVRRLTDALEPTGEPHEIVLVDDGSRDGSLAVMKQAHHDDPRIKVVNLSRNFGHQIAISAGLDHAAGDVVAIMDSDLQDPPEVLPLLLAKQKEGYDVVYAIRGKRPEGLLKRTAYAAFYRLMRSVANTEIPLDSGDFCVLSRRATDVLRGMPERNRFLRGLRGWIGFRQVGLEYDRDQRLAGEVKYTVPKLLRLAIDGFVSFSYVPLRLASVFGFLISALSFVGVLLTFYLRLFTTTADVPGWASTAVLILFLGGVQLMTIGIAGEYLGRIYDEVKRRPLYIVDDLIGFESQTNET